MTKKQLTKAAVFDVDGTIFRSSLLIEVVDQLIRSGFFPPNASKEYQPAKLTWQNRKGSYENYIKAVIETFVKHIKGVSYADFMSATEKVVEREQYKVYRFTRDLLAQLKEDGYFLLAVSQSPKSILEPFCKGLNFDKVYGRIMQIGPTNRFTGEVEDLHLIANKANIVRRALEKESLTLKNSIGVGDTEDDIPFLELVDQPICFNPNRSLYREAKRNHWSIVVERKDVIYPINVSPEIKRFITD